MKKLVFDLFSNTALDLKWYLMSDIEEILDYLEYISQQKRNVSLVNFYQGVSISLEVNILEISRRRRDVTVTTRYGQNISLLPATKILIHCDLFPQPIQAIVNSVDVHHRTAVLKNFVYHINSEDGRKETRVQLEGKIKARVIYQGESRCSGNIADISLEGIRLILEDEYSDLELWLKPKSSIQLFFQLPVSNQSGRVDLSFWAKVSYLNELEDTEGFRIGFMTYPSVQDKTVLRRYIFDRQTDLFSEVGQNLPKTNSSSLIT